MEKEPYNQRDHIHCFDQKVPACGIDKASHKVCCLCEKPMENKETNYCDSRTNEERERDSKIEVTMTTTNNDEFTNLDTISHEDKCEHEWVDATNEKVTGTKYCKKCKTIESHD